MITRRINGMMATQSIMMLVMTLIVILAGMAVNYGIHAGFMIKWFKSLALAFVVTLPAVFMIMPIIKKTISSCVIE